MTIIAAFGVCVCVGGNRIINMTTFQELTIENSPAQSKFLKVNQKSLNKNLYNFYIYYVHTQNKISNGFIFFLLNITNIVHAQEKQNKILDRSSALVIFTETCIREGMLPKYMTIYR